MVTSTRDVLFDAGPLVAVLDARDQWHSRCVDSWPVLIDRCITVEAVVTEACHLVLRGGAPASKPLEFLLKAGIPIVGLDTPEHRRADSLMSQYAKVPMDLADACLVAAAEALHITGAFTIDRRGFTSYRPPRGKHFTLYPQRTARRVARTGREALGRRPGS